MRDDTPSSTALLIARATVLLSQEPHSASLIPAGAAEGCASFVRACDRNQRFLRLCRHRWFRALIRSVERRTLPGILVHYALRKRALEETVRKALNASDCRQVVILGAGFDTLALRLHVEYPQVLFVEGDHPMTQGVKRSVLETTGPLPPNLILLPLDLSRDNLDDGLSSTPGYNPQATTLFIAEGLLMYLPLERVGVMFDEIRRRCGLSGLFAFTFLEPQASGGVDFQHPSRIIGHWLKRHQAPFRWGIEAASLPAFLGSFGFIVESVQTPENLRRRFLPAESTSERCMNGDLVCVAITVA
jgi:methyltransferase (TIGR00027 family)